MAETVTSLLATCCSSCEQTAASVSRSRPSCGSESCSVTRRPVPTLAGDAVRKPRRAEAAIAGIACARSCRA
eukprot:4499626-Prymnesium_polylepis.2